MYYYKGYNRKVNADAHIYTHSEEWQGLTKKRGGFWAISLKDRKNREFHGKRLDKIKEVFRGIGSGIFGKREAAEYYTFIYGVIHRIQGIGRQKRTEGGKAFGPVGESMFFRTPRSLRFWDKAVRRGYCSYRSDT